jgi:apolipoprotein N-acyltransferase
MGIDQLKKVLSDKNVLLLFWIHFLTANLMLGAWIAADAAKNKALQFIVLVPLIFTYFLGPIGLGIYLLLRLLAAQKLKLFD